MLRERNDDLNSCPLWFLVAQTAKGSRAQVSGREIIFHQNTNCSLFNALINCQALFMPVNIHSCGDNRPPSAGAQSVAVQWR